MIMIITINIITIIIIINIIIIIAIIITTTIIIIIIIIISSLFLSLQDQFFLWAPKSFVTYIIGLIS